MDDRRIAQEDCTVWMTERLHRRIAGWMTGGLHSVDDRMIAQEDCTVWMTGGLHSVDDRRIAQCG